MGREMGREASRKQRAEEPELGGRDVLPACPASLPCNVGRVYLTRSSSLSH